MKIFVTGATGVVGRRALPLMLAAGHRVSAVARRADQSAALAQAGAIPVAVNLFDRESVRRAVAGHDAIVNLATHLPASTGRMLLPGAWRENDRLRRDAAATLAGAALEIGAERFIQESFAPVYPDRGDGWIHEDTSLEPVRFNRTVMDAEAAAQGFARAGGVGIVLRFAAFYGPDAGQTLDMIKLVRKGWAPLPGSPDAFFRPYRTTTQRPQCSRHCSCRRAPIMSRTTSRCAIANSPNCSPQHCESRRRKCCHPG